MQISSPLDSSFNQIPKGSVHLPLRNEFFAIDLVIVSLKMDFFYIALTTLLLTFKALNHNVNCETPEEINHNLAHSCVYKPIGSDYSIPGWEANH